MERHEVKVRTTFPDELLISPRDYPDGVRTSITILEDVYKIEASVPGRLNKEGPSFLRREDDVRPLSYHKEYFRWHIADGLNHLVTRTKKRSILHVNPKRYVGLFLIIKQMSKLITRFVF